MRKPSVDDKFFEEFKNRTESRWSKACINPGVYGFQFQRGTRWNPGLTDTQIEKYEREIKVRFPDDFRRMLHTMNGTDVPMLNTYGFSVELHCTSTGVYAYQRDLEIVKSRIEDIREVRDAIEQVLAEQGFDLETEAALVPVYSHRYIVCTSDPAQSTILSISGTDAIVYGETLREYLVMEFLS
jgi:hypothetical protein